MPIDMLDALNLPFTARSGKTRALARTMAKSFSARFRHWLFPLNLMDRRTEPPIWPSGESEIPEENEIPEGRRCSSGFFLCGGACARDGLAHAAGLALSVSHRLDCGSSACWINRQPGSSPASFGHQVLWLSIQTARLWAAESSKRSLAPRTMRMTWQEHYSPGHAANPTVSISA